MLYLMLHTVHYMTLRKPCVGAELVEACALSQVRSQLRDFKTLYTANLVPTAWCVLNNYTDTNICIIHFKITRYCFAL